jgi:putative ABC transport system permease protein
MGWIALKMLFRDVSKYLMLVAGITFSTFLMVQQIGVFCGLMNWTRSTLKNVPAPIWVVDQKVEQVNETNPLLDTDVARVRSVQSVEWAAPLYSNIQRVRLPNGSFKLIQLIGIDQTSLAGAPVKILSGELEKIRLPNAVIIDDLAVKRLSLDGETPIKVGDQFEINDREAKVVAIADAKLGFTGGPYVWTTYERALEYSPRARKMLSAVLCAPREGVSVEQCQDDIEKSTGLKAYSNQGYGKSERDFNTTTVQWYIRNTGIPFTFGITVLVGFIVGMAISSQTFYTFVLENLKHLGALKAMGASNGMLMRMLILQATVVGVIGYGMGLAITSMFAFGAIQSEQAPFYMPVIVPFIVFGMVMLICLFSAFLGIWRVIRQDAATVFRG